ncbi:DUF3616 domain-containing protein (plasmid) [Rhizobium leguminosarum]
MSGRLVILSALSFGAAVAWGSCSRAEVVVQEGPLATQGSFDFHSDKKKEEKKQEDILKKRRSLSGIGCPVRMVDGQHFCLGAFDEGIEARTFTLGATEYEAHGTAIVLTTVNDDDPSEMDAEAVAADDRYYYVTGSHSMKRGDDPNNCEKNATTRHVVKIEYDPATGRPLEGASGTATDVYDKFQVSDLLDEVLGPLMGKCLGPPQNGIDIEGLAVYKKKLYFGLRGPTTDDGADGALAYVVEGDTSPPKTTGDTLKSPPFLIKVDKGHAIRDMAAVDDGILILIGPNDPMAEDTKDNKEKKKADDPPGTWSIAFWKVDEMADRKSPVKTVKLGDIPLWDKRPNCDEEIKPEGIAVLDNHTEGQKVTYQLAIVSDGMCDGGPVIVAASRPKD